MLSNEKLRSSVEIEDAVVVLFYNLVLRLKDFYTRIRHYNIKAAEIFERLLEEPCNFRHLSYVRFNRYSTATRLNDLVNNLLRSLLSVIIVNDDRGSALSQLDSDATSKASASSGN